MKDKKIEKIKELAQPLIEYIRNNHHPHTKIIIEDDFVEVVATIYGIPIEYEDKEGKR